MGGDPIEDQITFLATVKDAVATGTSWGLIYHMLRLKPTEKIVNPNSKSGLSSALIKIPEFALKDFGISENDFDKTIELTGRWYNPYPKFPTFTKRYFKLLGAKVV